MQPKGFQHDYSAQLGESITIDSNGERCRRTAIKLNREDLASVDILDSSGRLLCRLNIADTAGDHQVLPRGNVDVIPMTGNVSGLPSARFYALLRGKPVVAVCPPIGVQVYSVIMPG